MRIAGNEIRPGNIIEHKGHIWTAVRVQHVKPGKGGAYAQVELRNLRNGTKLNERFRSAENVGRVRLDQRRHQFLYPSDGQLVFMDLETYEQTEIAAETLGPRQHFLQDSMEVTIESFEGEALSVRLPEQVACVISETDPSLKGQTAAAAYKPAVLDNGIRVMVPPFLEAGERIVVNPETLEYAGRA